jgi:guanine deaminase
MQLLPGFEQINMAAITAIRGDILHFLSDPSLAEANEKTIESSYEYFQDGLLILREGVVEALGFYSELKETENESDITHHKKG